MTGSVFVQKISNPRTRGLDIGSHFTQVDSRRKKDAKSKRGNACRTQDLKTNSFCISVARKFQQCNDKLLVTVITEEN